MIKRRLGIWKWLAGCTACLFFAPLAMAQLPGGGAGPDLPQPPDVSAPQTPELPAPQAQGEAEAEVQGQAEGQLEGPAKGQAEAGADAEAGAEGEIQPDAGTEASGKVDAEADIDGKAGADADAGGDAKAGAEADVGAEAGADAKAGADVDADAETGADVDAGAEGKIEAGAEGDLEPAEGRPRLDADAEGELRGSAEARDSDAQAESRGKLGAFVSTNGRLMIRSIAEGSAATDAGLQQGDEILAVNGQRVSTHAELTQQLQAAGDADGQAEILVVRDGQMQRFNADVSGRFAADYSAQAPDAMPVPPNAQPYRTFYRGPDGAVYGSDGYRAAPGYDAPRRGFGLRRCR